MSRDPIPRFEELLQLPRIGSAEVKPPPRNRGVDAPKGNNGGAVDDGQRLDRWAGGEDRGDIPREETVGGIDDCLGWCLCLCL